MTTTRHFDRSPAPHRPPDTSVQRVMADVLLALLPGIALHVYFFGPGVLVQAAVATCAGLALEAAMLHARGRPLRPFLTDLSVPVTAILMVLCLPPLLPWWAVSTGMVFAIVIAKHLYGGLGFNVFNPAMVGYVTILICFPREATAWLPSAATAPAPALADTLGAVFGSGATAGWEGLTGATVLDLVRSGLDQGRMLAELQQGPAFDDPAGAWLAAAWGAGGAWLLHRRVISWHVPTAMLGIVVALSLPAVLYDPDTHPTPLFHLASGGLLLGAFFIATDPVSGSSTPRGRLIFGAGVGLLTLVIRRWGGYPDGVAFAVLLMNCAVPLIDRWTAPRIFGRPR